MGETYPISHPTSDGLGFGLIAMIYHLYIQCDPNIHPCLKRHQDCRISRDWSLYRRWHHEQYTTYQDLYSPCIKLHNAFR
ncbi:hypothetical protein BDV26DRAFT_270084 [Aspergillus bertholletiae]|uniref:Uncharacterized protein n=1 Tax=Aspergillus bertholletiae TaxID=1226010 RepID=A0A5N7AZQ4_9EURO|nr:hypothetical protein BDV26DRAFT_270084 [Aspergillus bertholletiae]